MVSYMSFVFIISLLRLCIAFPPPELPHVETPDGKQLFRSKSSPAGSDHKPPVHAVHQLDRSSSDCVNFNGHKAPRMFDRFRCKHIAFRSMRHWPLDARLTWMHPSHSLQKLPPKDRLKLRDGIVAKLRTSLQTNAPGHVQTGIAAK